MSQPPSPYDRQFSFTGWSITHPGEPHQGDKVDLELDEIKQSLDETQARLAEIQRDDGLIRAEALSTSLQALADDAAAAAATAVYATNLAQLSNKAEARQNLELPQYYVQLNGYNFTIYNDANSSPSFPSWDYTHGQVSQGQESSYPNWPGILAGSTYASRQFRASVLFGTTKDYATDWVDNSGSPVPDVTERVDNVGFALLYAGNPPEYTGTSYAGWVNMLGYLTGEYNKLANMPSIGNPLVSCYMLKDAIQTHNGLYDHTRIPTIAEKLILYQAVDNGASEYNRLATMNDLSAGGVLNADQAQAVAGSLDPSSSNVVITTSALNLALDTKAEFTHTHAISEITDLDYQLSEKASVADLSNKADWGHSHAQFEVLGLTEALSLKANVNHTHVMSDVSGLTSALNGKASSYHTHGIGEVTGLMAAINDARPVFVDGFLIFTAQDYQQYKVAAELVT